MFKSDFPLFAAHPELIYLDSAATSQKPEIVIEAVAEFYRTKNATVHRGLYPSSIAATEQYEHVRTLATQFIGATDPNEIVFTHGATEALNLLAHGLAQQLKPGDEIIISTLEHHANLVPWQQIPDVKLIFAPLTAQGEIDLGAFRKLVSNRTKIVSFSLCSNVLGTVPPFREIKEILKSQGSALLIADAAQAVAHFPISVAELQCDALVFSSHKMYGPSGVGVLWGRKSLLESLSPYQTGGEMIKTVTETDATWNDVPWKFEAGTPNIEGVIGLGAAFTYLNQIGMNKVAEHTTSLSLYAFQQLATLPEVVLLSKPREESGIISFVVQGIHPHDVAETLGEQQICIRAGHHCAAPLHDRLGIPASNRISFGIYTTREDIAAFIAGLKKVITFFRHV